MLTGAQAVSSLLEDTADAPRLGLARAGSPALQTVLGEHGPQAHLQLLLCKTAFHAAVETIAA